MVICFAFSTKNAERNLLSTPACNVFTHLKLKQQSPRQYDNSIFTVQVVYKKRQKLY